MAKTESWFLSRKSWIRVTCDGVSVEVGSGWYLVVLGLYKVILVTSACLNAEEVKEISR